MRNWDEVFEGNECAWNMKNVLLASYEWTLNIQWNVKPERKADKKGKEKEKAENDDPW